MKKPLFLDEKNLAEKNALLEKLVALCQEWTVHLLSKRRDHKLVILSALAELSASFIADLPFTKEIIIKEEYLQKLQEEIDRFNGLVIPKSFGL